MMKMNNEDIRLRAEALAERLKEIKGLNISVEECFSQIGGGLFRWRK